MMTNANQLEPRTAHQYDASEPRPDLTGMTLDELERFMADLGKERYRAAQVMKWIHQGLADSFQQMTNLSKGFREDLELIARVGPPRVVSESRSRDGVRKFLLHMRDGCGVEAVLIPEDDHDTLCVSTQVGCSMGCKICRTARMGLVRNLTAGEIVGQVLTVRKTAPSSRITNVVFMGMGEPLANYLNAVKAIRILTHPTGPQISWRRLTVSTSGLAPRISRLGRDVRAKLAVSLNAVTDEQRDFIMPVNRAYPLEDLLEALREYPLPRRDRITIEYVLIKDFNDSDADARRLVKLLNPIRAKVNLIPLNDDMLEDFRSPDPERVARFQEILMSRSLMAIIRKSRGRDVLAACGQLAGGSREL